MLSCHSPPYVFFFFKKWVTTCFSRFCFLLTRQKKTSIPESCIWAWPLPARTAQTHKHLQEAVSWTYQNTECGVCMSLKWLQAGYQGNSAHQWSLPKGTLMGLCPDVWEGERAEHVQCVRNSFQPFRCCSINLPNFRALGISDDRGL